MRFIMEVIKGTLVVNNRKKIELLAELKSKGYKCVAKVESEPQQQQGDDDDNATINSSQSTVIDTKPISAEVGYDYLLSMKIWSLTMEKVQDLHRQRDAKKAEWDKLTLTTAESLWLEDLINLEAALDKYEGQIEAGKKQELAARKKARNDKAAKSRGTSKAKPKGRKGDYGDSDEDDGDTEQSDFEGESNKRKKKAVTAPKQSSSALAKLTAVKPVSVPTTTSSSSNVLKATKEATSSKAKASDDSSKPVKEKKPRAPSAKSLAKAAASTAATTSKPITTFFKSKKSKSSSDDDDASDNDELELVEKVERAPRAAAVMAKTKAAATIHQLVDSDDEVEFDGAESDDEDDEDGFVEEHSFDFIASDSDSDAAPGYIDIKAIKAKAKKANTKPSKKEDSTKAVNVTKEKKQKKSAFTSTDAGATKKGTKRVVKSSDMDEDGDDGDESAQDDFSSKKAPMKKKLKAQTSAFESAPPVEKKSKAVKVVKSCPLLNVSCLKYLVTYSPLNHPRLPNC